MRLADVAAVGTLVGALAAVVGLVFVWLQLREATEATQTAALAAKAQATIQFQERFKESRNARGALFEQFPVHASLGGRWEPLNPENDVDDVDGRTLRSWVNLDDLTATDRQHADAVINALNDVAQYVADGLELRSALQQYHSIFIRVGALLNPYIDLRNRREPGGEKRVRIGRRVPVLYNAGLAYHRCHPKHVGRAVDLVRRVPLAELPDLPESSLGSRLRKLASAFIGSIPSTTPSATTPRTTAFRLRLIGTGKDLAQFAGFADDQEPLILPEDDLLRAVKAAEDMLRR